MYIKFRVSIFCDSKVNTGSHISRSTQWKPLVDRRQHCKVWLNPVYEFGTVTTEDAYNILISMCHNVADYVVSIFATYLNVYRVYRIRKT